VAEANNIMKKQKGRHANKTRQQERQGVRTNHEQRAACKHQHANITINEQAELQKTNKRQTTQTYVSRGSTNTQESTIAKVTTKTNTEGNKARAKNSTRTRAEQPKNWKTQNNQTQSPYT